MTLNAKKRRILEDLQRAIKGITKMVEGQKKHLDELRADPAKAGEIPAAEATLAAYEMQLKKVQDNYSAVENAPDGVMADEKFLRAIWRRLKNLARWLWAVAKGAFFWVVEVVVSLVRFVERCIHDLGDALA